MNFLPWTSWMAFRPFKYFPVGGLERLGTRVLRPLTPYDGMEFGKLAGYWERIEAAASRLEMTSLLGGLLRERETDAAVVSKVIYLCQGQIAPGFKGYDI